jgi:molecular chaperone GrpE
MKFMKDKNSPNQTHAPHDPMVGPTDNSQSVPNQVSAPEQDHATPTTSNATTIVEGELQQTVEKLQAELAAANDKYIRLYADFDNFRKRTSQERILLMETAGEKLLQQFLPILDDFERALGAIRQENVSLRAVEEGVQLIHDKMLHFLEQAGVEIMPLEKGSVFNTELHEAITRIPVTEKDLHDKVIDVIEKGYTLKSKVLRYAKVIIGG